MVSLCTPMEATTIDPGDARLATLRILRDTTLELGYPPSLKVLAGKRDLSVPGVKKHLDWLEKNGIVTKRKNEPKSCVVTELGRRILKNRRGGR